MLMASKIPRTAFGRLRAFDGAVFASGETIGLYGTRFRFVDEGDVLVLVLGEEDVSSDDDEDVRYVPGVGR
jgi:hypothetical protein